MSYLRSYLRYVKSTSEETKNLHSIFLAGLLTGIFIVIYLYLVRDIAPPAPSLSGEAVTIESTTNLEPMDIILRDNKKNTESVAEFDPINSIRDAFRKVSEDVSNLRSDLSPSNAVIIKMTATSTDNAKSTSVSDINSTTSATSTEYRSNMIEDMGNMGKSIE